ncbi:squamous cell carcinoma antigen recognized by T-cells 3 [Aricia agestis]|uniref:squamous cell carcinoma antigen recognized by T-cells 3 n=1 Tax=Aricia agestis TaxID=91739 RepID=UPI001C205090|nr:squamous cell carcinoma antigen recognized by T-cells 3 [Aricia agestis]
MAIVEDEVRNGSEEENEMEVVPEDDDADQDSDDSDDEDEEDSEEALEKKVADLEEHLAIDPYNYDDHIELIQALWSLTELDRWRSAFERLQQLTIIKPEHWLLRLQTEETLAHSEESKEKINNLFLEATIDCYSIPILSEWCSWAMNAGDTDKIRLQLDEVLKRAGADPLSGKIFWDAKIEMEKAKLESMNVEDPEYKDQRDRVVWSVEEAASRPLLRGEDAWALVEELQHTCSEKMKKQHEAAMEYLQKITPYEDKLLTIEDVEEKCKIYQEYIDSVKNLAEVDKFAECDSNGILKVLYDRATTECLSCEAVHDLLLAFVRHVQKVSSRDTIRRVLDICTRRCSTKATFWVLKMQQAEHEEKSFDEVKSIFEVALSKGMESYKQSETLWMSYLEYSRRRTNFDNEAEVDRLRRTFRLAWDSLAEAWGEEANDCEVPLFWARLEYKLMKNPKQGKEIFEEIFKYGENKTLSKYWEALVSLEVSCGGRRLRELLARALRCVADYPPAVARLWTDHERDHGDLRTLRDCQLQCEIKLKEWRDNYQAMKEKMMGNKQKGKGKGNEKGKQGNKRTKEAPNKGKRKLDDKAESSEGKRKKEVMEVDVQEKDGRVGLKRTHDNEDDESTASKRLREESESASGSREECTLFVSNLEFKVNEDNLRKKLSEYGTIVSMRVKAGVKAFGGSICYCQYTSPSAVEKAVKDDRTPLDGRPMFLSKYSAKKGNPTFKYATEKEQNKLFVRNLPFAHCTKEALAKVFDKYGKLRDVRIVTFKDGKPKGLAYIEYEDEKSAAEALSKTNGMLLGDRNIDVAISAPPQRAAEPATLGQPKRDVRGGMRRTQLSNLIPSVLQKPSTSQAANGSTNGAEKKTLTNSDFRSLLLK